VIQTTNRLVRPQQVITAHVPFFSLGIFGTISAYIRWISPLRNTIVLNLKKHLLACLTEVEEARARGETHLPASVIEHLTATYHQLISAGLAAQPPPPPSLPKKKGRVKQTKAKNLLDRLQRDAASFLLFLSDFRVPFTNNGSQQDLRMVPRSAENLGHFPLTDRSCCLLSHSWVLLHHG